MSHSTTTGGFAFQFSPTNGIIQHDWTAIHPDSRWDDLKGYGLGHGAKAKNQTTPYPTPVMGGGITFDDAVFEVRLPGGKYIGWVIFERSGFWDGDQARYHHCDFSVNNQVVYSHDSDPAESLFLLENTEVLNQDQLINKMILPVQQVADISFLATNGKNTFTLSADSDRPPRLAGLVIAPDTEAGRAYINTYKKQQNETIRSVHRLTGMEKRPGDPSRAIEPVIAIPLPSETAMHPGDWPAAIKSASVPPMQGFAGLTANRLLGLYAKSDVLVQASISAFTGEEYAAGETLPASSVRLQQNVYLPIRNFEQTGATIETHHYIPADKPMTLNSTLARSLLIQVDIPANTKYGKYIATLTLDVQPDANQTTPVQKTQLQIPVTLQVHAGSLVGPQMNVGLFYSSVPASPSEISSELYWKLTADMFHQMHIGSLSILAGGPDFSVSWNDNTPVWSGDDAVKFINMAKPYSLDRATIEYGGLSTGIARELPPAHEGMSIEQTLTALATAWHDFELKNALPEHYLNVYDEPSTPSDFEGIDERLTALRNAGFKTIGFTSVENPIKADANHTMLVRLTDDPAFSLYTPETLQWAQKLGAKPWLYGGDLSRQSFGIDLWRAHNMGVKGRLGWIGSIVQGFQYDTLDSREPDPSCFYVHSKLGVLIAPQYLGVIEGGIDRRLLFEMERISTTNTPAAEKAKAILADVEAKPFRNTLSWEEIEALRQRMMKVMDETAQ